MTAYFLKSESEVSGSLKLAANQKSKIKCTRGD